MENQDVKTYGKRQKLVRASIHQTQAEISSVDVKAAIYKSGVDNLYPQRIERIQSNSPTASACCYKLNLYSYGKGIQKINDIIVFEDKKITFLEFHRNFIQSVCTHRGVFVNVIYKPVNPLKEDDKGNVIVDQEVNEFETFFKVLPYSHCRLGRPDSTETCSKVAVCPDWQNANSNTKNIDYIDTYNPDPRVVLQQIAEAGHINDYKGQVMFMHMDNSIYPLATIDPVYNDADSEYRLSLRRNNVLRYGVASSTIYIVKETSPYVNALPDTKGNMDNPNNMTAAERNYIEQSKYEEKIDETTRIIKSTKGVENAGTVATITIPSTEDPKDFIHKVDMADHVDADFYTESQKSLSESIRKPYATPKILTDQSDNSIFGQSGESIKQAKIEYQEHCGHIRQFAEQCYKKLFTYHSELSKYEDCIIDLLIDPKSSNKKLTDISEDSSLIESDQLKNTTNSK